MSSLQVFRSYTPETWPSGHRFLQTLDHPRKYKYLLYAQGGFASGRDFEKDNTVSHIPQSTFVI